MKSYTNIEQSKKLTKILPGDSADMCWGIDDDTLTWNTFPYLFPWRDYTAKEYYLPCWSLAALLDYLSANFHIDIKYLDTEWELDCRVQVTYARELIDACYEMILKLHEENLL